MSRSRDRTEDLKDAVRVAAISSGYTESKLAAILASFIMHKSPERQPFTKAALKTLSSINELERFIVKHRKDYVGLHRTTEQERDDIEHEVSIFIKSCKDQIDVLKNGIHEEEKSGNARTWLNMRDVGSNADVVAHKHGVVLILSEQLHAVTAQFDQLRSVRFQDAVNKAMPRRKMHKMANLKSSESVPSDVSEITGQDLSSGPVRIQDQLLDDETQALQVELTSLLDAVQETEKRMVEMSALNHLMSTHVLQQAQQIEQLYEQAVEATMNVERGNKELSQAIQRNSSSRTFLVLFLFVLTFSIIFLDWYS
ncbi:syntaxin-81 [Dioscorea cayenensis subsp. rotundata]|uniref:Syntaxin-81 n=1 Tax=Dioscorea cayennensis subsp. rotundata TaxID=55577 RepID=A0AB40BYL7_DIOCR|nr:syntaxin-81 [Dioscorea cayenensis subsp. rotundata]XP_039132159.1 syntaxin-81 [Dioscorea cayenensis subsp. rotundata]